MLGQIYSYLLQVFHSRKSAHRRNRTGFAAARALRSECLEGRALLAGDYTIFDINQTGAPVYGRTAAVGSNLFYWDTDPVKGVELFKLDSTSNTASLYLDINPGVGNSYTSYTEVAGFAVVDSRLFFVAYDAVQGQHIRWIDTSESTPTLHTLPSDPSLIVASSLLVAGDRIYFVGDDEAFGGELRWIDALSASPSIQVIDAAPGNGSSLNYENPKTDFQVHLSGDRLFYKISNVLRWIDLSQTAPVVNKINAELSIDGNQTQFTQTFLAGDKLFFTAYDNALGNELRWIDVNEETPSVHSLDINQGLDGNNKPYSSLTVQYGFAIAGNKLYFSARDEAVGTELRWLDYTLDDPSVHTIDIYTGTGSSLAGLTYGLNVVDEKLYFIARNRTLNNNYMRWIDTTLDEPILNSISTVIGIPQSSPQSKSAVVGDKFFFVASPVAGNPLPEQAIWIDTTNAPSVLNLSQLSLNQYREVGYRTYGDAFTTVGDKLYFAAITTAYPTDYKLRGIDTTATQLAFSSTDLYASSSSSQPWAPVTVGTKLYFSARYDPYTWKMTWIDTAQSPNTTGTLDTYLNETVAVVGSRLYFLGGSIRSGRALQWIDTSLASPVVHMIADIDVRNFVVADNKVLFEGLSGPGSKMYWVDLAANQPVLNTFSSNMYDVPSLTSSMFAAGSEVYFMTYSQSSGEVLNWIDTTAATPTLRTIDLDSDATSSPLATPLFTVAGNKLYFTLSVGLSAQELRWIDITDVDKTVHAVTGFGPEPVNGIRSFRLIDDLLYFVAKDENAFDRGSLYWIDTSVSPSIVGSVKHDNGEAVVLDISPFFENQLAIVGEKLFFTSNHKLSWVDTSIDPTFAYVMNVLPSRHSDEYDFSFTVVRNLLYFEVDDAQYRGELRWIDTSINSPTLHTLDLNKDYTNSFEYDAYVSGSPYDRIVVNDRLYFAELDQKFGWELRWIDTTEVSPVIHTIDFNSGKDSSDPALFGFVPSTNRIFYLTTLHGYGMELISLDASVPPGPTSVDDSYDIPVNYAGIVTTIEGGVLGNDSGADGDTLTAELLTLPSRGTLMFNADGTFRYVPATSAAIGDIETFTYRVTDAAGLSSEGTVTLRIAGAIDSPFNNTAAPTDVSPGANPGTTSSLDALAVVNFLNSNRGRISIPVLDMPQAETPVYFYDVNNDFVISSLDLLAVYNFINTRTRGGEGEGGQLASITSTAPGVSTAQASQADLYDAALVDLSELDKLKSRRSG